MRQSLICLLCQDARKNRKTSGRKTRRNLRSERNQRPFEDICKDQIKRPFQRRVIKTGGLHHLDTGAASSIAEYAGSTLHLDGLRSADAQTIQALGGSTERAI